MPWASRKVSWKAWRGSGSSVRPQLEDLWMKWPRYDTIMSPDNRKINSEDTCLEGVKEIMTICLVERENVGMLGAEKHECGELKEELWPEPQRLCK